MKLNEWLRNRLRCPDCHHPGLADGTSEIVCSHCRARFPLIDGRPVLLRHDNAVFPPDAYREAVRTSAESAKKRFSRFVPSISVNLSSDPSLFRLAAALSNQGKGCILVVGGGSQRRWLDKRFGAFPSVRLVYCDVDAGALVDLYCDAHELPFLDACFDGVITTAVLEHVLYPELVAAEIHRVLRPDGLLYSELPFMQQVHEGAYDFTRYTLSGHRRLFNHFAEIDSGLVAGPATALAWAIENFTLAFFAGQHVRLAVKAVVRLGCFWIKYFDYLFAHKPQAVDGASCTYFMGRRQTQRVPDVEIIERYVGAKRLDHI